MKVLLLIFCFIASASVEDDNEIIKDLDFFQNFEMITISRINKIEPKENISKEEENINKIKVDEAKK